MRRPSTIDDNGRFPLERLTPRWHRSYARVRDETSATPDLRALGHPWSSGLRFRGRKKGTEDEVHLSDSPWEDDRYFDPPDAETISQWTYILRYTEATHAQTPLVVDWYRRDDMIRIVVRRISGGEVDLKYIREIEVDSSPALSPPEWSLKLPESDSVSGLDGTSTSVQLFFGETTRTISRWSPTHDEDERGLKEFNGWVALMKRVTGIHARLLLGDNRQKRTDEDGEDQTPSGSEFDD